MTKTYCQSLYILFWDNKTWFFAFVWSSDTNTGSICHLQMVSAHSGQAGLCHIVGINFLDRPQAVLDQPCLTSMCWSSSPVWQVTRITSQTGLFDRSPIWPVKQSFLTGHPYDLSNRTVWQVIHLTSQTATPQPLRCATKKAANKCSVVASLFSWAHLAIVVMGKHFYQRQRSRKTATDYFTSV
jgi:hypothetical protein